MEITLRDAKKKILDEIKEEMDYMTEEEKKKRKKKNPEESREDCE
jgi:hypothetical protein